MKTDPKFGLALAVRRQQRGIKQEEMATLLGVHQTTLWKIENGQRSLEFSEAVTLCRYLGLGLDDLAGA